MSIERWLDEKQDSWWGVYAFIALPIWMALTDARFYLWSLLEDWRDSRKAVKASATDIKRI